MKLAHCNAMSVGIFSWAALEPEEGRFTFDWLDQVMDDLANNGVFAVLATPSGARPAWMSQKYPEVLRVNADRTRILHGARHNHCYTSPVYREKTALINRKLAERYQNHPALLVWHISNEYGGECHCALCQDAFRAWLKERYGSLEALNRGVVDGILESHLHRLVANRISRGAWRVGGSRSQPRLEAVCHPSDDRFHEERDRAAARAHAERAL